MSAQDQQRQLIENSIIDLRSSSCLSSSPSASNSSLSSTSEGSISNTELIILGIIHGLSRSKKITPGLGPQDTQYTYRKTIPTLTLYDDLGLILYDQITATPEYYPYENELKILKLHGPEIARSLCGLTGAEMQSGGKFQSTTPFEGPQPDSPQSITRTISQSFPAEHQSPSLSAQSRVSLSIVELGAGSLKKTAHILRNTAHILRERPCGKGACLSEAEYYALDLEYNQLVSTLLAVQLDKESGVGATIGEEVQIRGICGTYSQGLGWLTQYLSTSHSTVSRPYSPDTDHSILVGKDHRNAILWLGSSIGNFSPREALAFLNDEVGPALHHHQTRILIGIDNCKIPEKVQRAYDDSKGVTRKFILNGISVVARALGLAPRTLSPNQFEYHSRFNEGMSRNEAYLRARERIEFTTPEILKNGDKLLEEGMVCIEENEMILMEHSYKYSDEEAYELFNSAGLRVIQSWSDQSHLPSSVRSASGPGHTLYLVEHPGFSFGNTMKNSKQLGYRESDPLAAPAPKNASSLDTFVEMESPQSGKRIFGGNVPSLRDWTEIWKAWDSVTLNILPQELLYSKPINLRHICLFYLGHIPVFADIQLSRHFKVPYSEPRKFSEIFERGIDPNMETNQCHDHSKVPDREEEWPSLKEILKFRDSLRARISDIYQSLGAKETDNDLIVLTRSLARVLWMIYEHEAMHLETFVYMLVQVNSLKMPPNFTPPDWVSLSRQWDLEADGSGENIAGKLIEYPNQITLHVGHDDSEEEDDLLGFSQDHEFGWDNEHPSRQEIVDPFKLSPKPISNREYLEYLLKGSPTGPILEKDIPASWDYAFDPEKNSHEINLRTIYGLVPLPVGHHWPVQASGRQLAAYAHAFGGRLPSANELRVYFKDNSPGGPMSPIGFQHWHPVPARAPKKNSDGIWRGGMNGGVWEWTGTLFEKFDGFQSSRIYPGYSSDFFDGVHSIVLGGSWATLPHIAKRRSFVNWYQTNYPYAFVSARVAYDY